MSWLVDILASLLKPFLAQPKVRVRYERGTWSSGPDRGGRPRFKWEGTLELYNSEPYDAFGVRLDFPPGREIPLEPLRHDHLGSGECRTLSFVISREFDRSVVEACTPTRRFEQLMPKEIRFMECRVRYRNKWKLKYYTRFTKRDDEQECTYHRREPAWKVA